MAKHTVLLAVSQACRLRTYCGPACRNLWWEVGTGAPEGSCCQYLSEGEGRPLPQIMYRRPSLGGELESALAQDPGAPAVPTVLVALYCTVPSYVGGYYVLRVRQGIAPSVLSRLALGSP